MTFFSSSLGSKTEALQASPLEHPNTEVAWMSLVHHWWPRPRCRQSCKRSWLRWSRWITEDPQAGHKLEDPMHPMVLFGARNIKTADSIMVPQESISVPLKHRGT